MTETGQMPYSSRARIALAIARAIAAGRGDIDLTPIHVALGLLREGENAAVAVLQHRGVALPEIRRELEVLLGERVNHTRPEEVVVSTSPGEQRVIDQARHWSRHEGDTHIGPEHLFLAILGDAQSQAAETFAKHGIQTETALASMGVVVHKHPHPRPW